MNGCVNRIAAASSWRALLLTKSEASRLASWSLVCATMNFPAGTAATVVAMELYRPDAFRLVTAERAANCHGLVITALKALVVSRSVP